jgi:hypothetical protein
MNFTSNVIICLALVALFFITVNGTERENVETCDSLCTMDYYSELKSWIHPLYLKSASRRKYAENHPFISAIEAGVVPRKVLLDYFQGMYWHVARSGHLFMNLALQRPPAVKDYLASIGGRVDDGHSSEVYIYIYIYIYIYLSIHINISIHIYRHIYIHTCIHKHIHTYTYTNIHIYTLTHTYKKSYQYQHIYI